MGRLGWTPAETWAATPRELAFALGLRRGAGALNRRGLDALMERFPDEGETGWQMTA
ncbi:phage tail assembly chaperone [Pannonibacter sp. Pt2-lr]